MTNDWYINLMIFLHLVHPEWSVLLSVAAKYNLRICLDSTNGVWEQSPPGADRWSAGSEVISRICWWTVFSWTGFINMPLPKAAPRGWSLEILRIWFEMERMKADGKDPSIPYLRILPCPVGCRRSKQRQMLKHFRQMRIKNFDVP